jgi:hypothetical protein
MREAFTDFVNNYAKVKAWPLQKHRAGVALMQSDLIYVMRDSIDARGGGGGVYDVKWSAKRWRHKPTAADALHRAALTGIERERHRALYEAGGASHPDMTDTERERHHALCEASGYVKN